MARPGLFNFNAMRILCFLGFCSTLSPGLLGQKKGLTVLHQWSRLEFNYPNEAARQEAIRTGEFVPGNGIPIDVDVHYGDNGKNRIFVTVPRFQLGIPSSLNTVINKEYNSNPILKPYPSWEWHRNSQACRQNRIISVFRTQVDKCNRLWVLDSGNIGGAQLCKAQILAFDLKTDQLVHKYEIPDDQLKIPTSLLITPVVDLRDTCDDVFVYAGDVTGFGIVVHDVRNNKSWRVQNKLMFPVPDYGTFTIAGESFDLMDGILGMAISPYRYGQDRALYFHALASATENVVYTSVLRNETIFKDNADAEPRKFQVFSKKRSSQSAAEAMDKNGILYFGLLRETSMACWNSRYEYGPANFDILENNVQNLQFPSGVKIVQNKKGAEELWIMTCRFQKVMTGTINQETEINFRIQAVKIDNFVAGSRCAAGIRPQGPGGQRPIRPQQGGGYGLLPNNNKNDEIDGFVVT